MVGRRSWPGICCTKHFKPRQPFQNLNTESSVFTPSYNRIQHSVVFLPCVPQHSNCVAIANINKRRPSTNQDALLTVCSRTSITQFLRWRWRWRQKTHPSHARIEASPDTLHYFLLPNTSLHILSFCPTQHQCTHTLSSGDRLPRGGHADVAF